MLLSYWSFFASTFTRTNATCDPSGAICGSAIHTNAKRSFSVMGRRSPAGNPAASSTAAATVAVARRRTRAGIGNAPLRVTILRPEGGRLQRNDRDFAFRQPQQSDARPQVEAARTRGARIDHECGADCPYERR